MTTMSQDNAFVVAARPVRRGTLAAFGAWVVRAATRSGQRRALSRLDAVQLADIGVSYAQAQVEASRPFWR